MSIGEVRRVSRRELPCELPGARLWRFEIGSESSYVPYFYNPPLDPDGRRMIAVGRDGSEEQAWLLDLERNTATQLTGATGSGQNWSPYIREDVRGIRPQFICWSQPDWEHVLYWENNQLRRVHVETHRR